MKNTDLIAFLKPISNQFSGADSVEFIDVTGQVTDIQANPHRLSHPSGSFSGTLQRPFRDQAQRL